MSLAPWSRPRSAHGARPRRAVGRLALAGLVAALLAPVATAGTVLLLNGETIRGEIVDVSTLEVAVRVGSGVIRIRMAEIQDIRLDSGESIHSKLVADALAGLREELANESEERRRRRLGLPPERTPAPPSPLAEVPAEPLQRLTFQGAFESTLFAVRLRYPHEWKASQESHDYFTFRDPRSGARTWSFNLTVFEPFEASFEDVVRKAALELDGLRGLRVLRRRAADLGGVRAERTSSLFEREGLVIRHEQVVVEARRGRVFVLHFFVPGAGPGPVPEVEAVLGSLELLP